MLYTENLYCAIMFGFHRSNHKKTDIIAKWRACIEINLVKIEILQYSDRIASTTLIEHS